MIDEIIEDENSISTSNNGKSLPSYTNDKITPHDYEKGKKIANIIIARGGNIILKKTGELIIHKFNNLIIKPFAKASVFLIYRNFVFFS